jgi:hypothetical protein
LRSLTSEKNPPFEAADDRIHKPFATVRTAMISDIGNLRSQFVGENVNLPLRDATIPDRSSRPMYSLDECEPISEVT